MANDGKSADLYDLLAQSGKDTIDPMPAGVSQGYSIALAFDQLELSDLRGLHCCIPKMHECMH